MQGRWRLLCWFLSLQHSCCNFATICAAYAFISVLLIFNRYSYNLGIHFKSCKTMQIVAENLSTVAHVIQMAVAPVFLLTGVGAILSVLTGRLGRLVDRFRVLTETVSELPAIQARELSILTVRARWVHWAITLCTASALFVAIVIGALFVGAVANIDPSRIVSFLFIIAMTSLIIGLGCFLREISLSVHIFDLGKNIN